MALKPAYFAQEAVSNLRRNLLMAIASMMAVAISLVLLGSVGMLFKVVSNITRQWRDDVMINAYILDDASQAQITSAQESITEYKEVKEVTFVSKKEAYVEFADMFQNQEVFVDNVDADTLPASFRISLHDPDTLEVVSDRIVKIEGVEDVRTAKEVVRRIQTVINFTMMIIVGAAIILLGAAIVLISNTIRLAIFARRKEISIMKLVGATNWFVRWPFMIEGMIQGLVGALIAIAMMELLRGVVINWVSGRVAFLPLGIGVGYMLVVYVAIAVIGVGIAGFGTFLSLRKHLDV